MGSIFMVTSKHLKENAQRFHCLGVALQGIGDVR